MEIIDDSPKPYLSASLLTYLARTLLVVESVAVFFSCTFFSSSLILGGYPN
jgi:hypothetical protein